MDERTHPTAASASEPATTTSEKAHELPESEGEPAIHEPDPSSMDRADRVAERIAVPVLIAALASIPAVFLTLFDDPWRSWGAGLNTLSGAVLIAETVVLLALAQDRRSWVKRNRWLVLLALAIIPAVVFAVGPLQLLRLVRLAGALRIIRVGRIMKAGRIVRNRAGLTATWQRIIGVGATLLCAAFVALVLSDPSSSSRVLLDGAVARLGWIGVLIAGTILGVASYVVYSAGSRARTNDEPGVNGGGADPSVRESDGEHP